MFRRNSILTTAALVAVCALPVSAAADVDLRSPDARDAAGNFAVDQLGSSVDLRSPDARDAAGNYLDEPRSTVDLRSPDARDAGRQLDPAPVSTVQVAEPSSGFDWGDAGIGAAGMLALLGIAAGSMLLVTTTRRRRGFSATAH